MIDVKAFVIIRGKQPILIQKLILTILHFFRFAQILYTQNGNVTWLILFWEQSFVSDKTPGPWLPALMGGRYDFATNRITIIHESVQWLEQ